MARKKNPEIHVDINSHNFADNPRAVMDKLGKLSQRPHRTKTGGETKKPSPRLKERRAKNTKKGYFPNPGKSDVVYAEAVRLIERVQDLINRETDDIRLQAEISFVQGFIRGARVSKGLSLEDSNILNTQLYSVVRQK